MKVIIIILRHEKFNKKTNMVFIKDEKKIPSFFQKENTKMCNYFVPK